MRPTKGTTVPLRRVNDDAALLPEAPLVTAVAGNLYEPSVNMVPVITIVDEVDNEQVGRAR